MMRPFSLHTVLDYRGRLEDLAQQKLMVAEQAARQVAQRIAETETEIAATAAELAEKQRQGIDIREHITLAEGLDYWQRQLVALRDDMIKCLKNIETARGHLQKRSQEKKVMEKLKERQNAAWRQHINKRETAALDEIAILYHDKER